MSNQMPSYISPFNRNNHEDGIKWDAITDCAAWCKLDKTIYSLPAIMRTCYWLTDRAYVYISVVDTNNYAIRVESKTENIPARNIIGDFANQLIENELRCQISQETAAIREVLIKKALGCSS